MIEANTRLHHHEAVALSSGLQQGTGAPRNSNVMLHVDGWYQQHSLNPTAVPAQPRSAGYILDFDRSQHDYSADCIIGLRQPSQQQPSQQQQQQQQLYRRDTHSLQTTAGDCPESLKRTREVSDCSDGLSATASKRMCDSSAELASSSSSSSSHHGGVRITDLLNPAVVSAAAAAQRMTLPSTLARTRSDGAKHQHQSIARMQQQQQQLDSAAAATTGGSSIAVDPSVRFARTATAPTEASVKTAATYSSSCAQGLVREALELDKLYDIACVIIESAWPNHSISQRTQLCSLRCFVMETHRQSRLGTDVLELCMFYLLRAKSIIQAKQRAARQKEEQQEQEQQLKIRQQQQQQQQQQALLLQSMCSVSTPPLSPTYVQSAGRAVPSGSILATPSSVATKTEDSPYTPQEGQGVVNQVSYVPGDKQQILRTGMVAPFIAVDAKQQMQPQAQQRPLAGNTASLPVSYRSLVTPVPIKEVSAAGNGSSTDEAPAKPQQLQSPEEKTLGDSSTAAPTKKPKPDPTRCGRRMFVAALISASKFIYDQTYSNRAWNKITRLPMAQISDMERAFLSMIDYRLYVDRATYDKFHRLLARSGMRNGRLMVCDTNGSPTQSVLTPVSPPQTSAYVAGPPHPDTPAASGDHVPGSSGIPCTPGPSSAQLPAVVDLRTAMNAPLSISATPQISRTSSAASAQQMQEQVINLLRVQQQQQQQQQFAQHHYHHQQQQLSMKQQ
ncbi:PHO85 cyclin-5 [Coemansia sp. RSA 1722]|nr:PHO85 cyclin-5 [Coemansia sp. RSA 1722]